jgi:hypothetical protein
MMWLSLPARGMLPPCYRPDGSPDRVWTFTRELGDYRHEMRITIRGHDVLETWVINGQVRQEAPVQPRPKPRHLATWFACRSSELTLQGWRLSAQGAAPQTSPNQPRRVRPTRRPSPHELPGGAVK